MMSEHLDHELRTFVDERAATAGWPPDWSAIGLRAASAPASSRPPTVRWIAAAAALVLMVGGILAVAARRDGGSSVPAGWEEVPIEDVDAGPLVLVSRDRPVVAPTILPEGWIIEGAYRLGLDDPDLTPPLRVIDRYVAPDGSGAADVWVGSGVGNLLDDPTVIDGVTWTFARTSRTALARAQINDVRISIDGIGMTVDEVKILIAGLRSLPTRVDELDVQDVSDRPTSPEDDLLTRPV